MFSHKKYTDFELIEFIASGRKKSKAFSEFYDRHEKLIRTYLMYLIKNPDEVEDIFQETFTVFYTKVNSGFLPENPVGYLRSIARNKAYNLITRKKDKVSIDEIEIEADSCFNLENEELKAIIHDAIRTLKANQREIFVLKEIEGRSHKEIADICRISELNSRTILHRAYKSLNKILTPYIEELK